MAPAAIGIVPIPTSLLLIYLTYESTSVFPGSHLATSLSVLMAKGKSRVQQQAEPFLIVPSTQHWFPPYQMSEFILSLTSTKPILDLTCTSCT